MRAGAVSDPLNQRRTKARAGALQRPLAGRVASQKVVAIHPQTGNAAARAACCKGGAFTPGNGLKSGNGPLIVDHVDDDRRTVDVGKSQRGVKVGLGGGAVANPGAGHFVVALDGAGHGPAHGLNHLRGQVARNREKALFFAAVHHRQLAALHGVAGVAVELADHVNHLVVGAAEQQPLLAVGGKAHVALANGQRMGAGYGLFTQALHVKRHFFLPLGNQHAGIKGSGQHHGAQAAFQNFGADVGVPRALGLAGVV